ncbi:MAG: FAD-dependent thymidylate synthase [Polyangiaceae bacterium]
MTSRPSSEAAEEILGRYFPVLDHGFVSLVDYMGTDSCIERAARVSYGYGTRATNQTRGLLRYLRRHLHTTPSEMVELKFHCCMPMFVARQWIRHRTANVNEYSGRYSLMPMLFYTPAFEQLQKQSRSNNQGRSGEVLAESTYAEAVARWNAGREAARANYEWLTEHEIARELARIDLPLSCYTQWYWKIDLHNLLHFLKIARRRSRAMGNPGIRSCDGGDRPSRRAAQLRSVDRLRRLRLESEPNGTRCATGPHRGAS